VQVCQVKQLTLSSIKHFYTVYALKLMSIVGLRHLRCYNCSVDETNVGNGVMLEKVTMQAT